MERPRWVVATTSFFPKDSREVRRSLACWPHKLIHDGAKMLWAWLGATEPGYDGVMAEAASALRMSYDEYLAFDRASSERHQFVNGEVFAMAGGSLEHSLIKVNVIALLREALRDRSCLVFDCDFRIRTVDDMGTYPDASALCGTPQFSSAHKDELCNPSLIVEVLSPSTESYDRGDKFVHYGTIPSLQDYVLVASEHVMVEVFSRHEQGWLLRRYGADDQVPLASVGCELAVREIYRKVFTDVVGSAASLA